MQKILSKFLSAFTVFSMLVMPLATLTALPNVASADVGAPSGTLTVTYYPNTDELYVSGGYTAPGGQKIPGFALFINSNEPDTSETASLDNLVNLLPAGSTSGNYSKTYSGITSEPDSVCVVIYDMHSGDIGKDGKHSNVPDGSKRNDDNSWDANSNSFPVGSCAGDIAAPDLDDLAITCDAVSVNGSTWTMSGTWKADDFPGQASQYDAAIFSPAATLTDSSSKDVPDLFSILVGPANTSGGPQEEMSGTWSNQVIFGSVPSAILATLYHASVPGNESSGDATCSFTLPPQCSNGIDDDGDTFVDFPSDPGCTSGTDDTESPNPATTGTLVVTKVIVNDNGGVKEADNFSFQINGGDAIAFEADGSNSFEKTAGAYTVTEVVDADYDTEYSAGCTLGVTVGNTTTCTITNTFINTPPVITLDGDNPMDLTVGNVYVEPGATADDAEDGLDLLVSDITGTVNHLVIGVYQIFYNFTDSGNLDATEVVRTVNVNPGDTECSDGEDNDGDGNVDLDDDGCDSLEDDSENQPPVITVTGTNPVQLVVNVDSYNEEGATANDAEDGNGLVVTDVNDTEVDTSNVGAYTVYYNFIDSDGAAAAQKTRTVNVVAGDNECNDTLDNDGDGLTDFPEDLGCENIDDTSENEPPVINLIGSNPQIVTLDDSYSEQGATADDAEDGNGLVVTDVDATNVDTNTLGTYAVYYNFIDSDGAAAAEVTRDVQVKTVCSDSMDNDDDGVSDEEDPGCWINPNDSETYNETDGDETDPVDECPNIGGFQTKIPEGKEKNEAGECVDIVIPVDLCLNLDGIQTEVPEGYSTDNEGTCTLTPVLGCTDPYATNYNENATEGNENAEDCTYPEVPACSDNEDNDGDNLADEKDPGCHDDKDPNNEDSYDPNDNNENNSGGGGNGSSGSRRSSSGQVLGAETEICNWNTQYLRRGWNKNVANDVQTMQNFLNTHMTSGLAVDSVFGPLTEAAVKAFQSKYKADILTPWGINDPTGIWYLSTTTKAKEIMCGEKVALPPLIPWNQNPAVR